MAQDNLNRASLGVAYQNLTEVYFRAYAGDLGVKFGTRTISMWPSTPAKRSNC